MKLPCEDDLRIHIRAELASEFQLASELLNIGVGIFENLSINSPNMPDYDELGVGLGVIAKVCKQYRAVVGLSYN
jgi:hypothetical protein